MGSGGSPPLNYTMGHQYRQHHHLDEIKYDMKFKNPLPIYEQHYNNYDEYIMKTSAAGNQFMTENSIASKVHATKVD